MERGYTPISFGKKHAEKVVLDVRLCYCGILLYTVGYWGILLCIAGYCWVLLGTGWYWVSLGGTRGTGGTDKYCWVLEVIGSNRGYWGMLWSTVWYCGILMGTTGCWGVRGY